MPVNNGGEAAGPQSVPSTGGGGGSGTVTSVSVTTTNGFAGTVANSTTTPAITMETTITGLLKGNGTAVSAATAGTDYAAVAVGGDLSGSLPNPTVVGVQGVAMTAAEATLVSQLNGARTRTATGSPAAGEQTVITGTTASQTLTLPASTAQVSSPNLIVNNSTQVWSIAAGASTSFVTPAGTPTTINLVPGTYAEFYLIGTVWYMCRYSLAPPQIFNGGAGGTTTAWTPSGTGNGIFEAFLVGGGGAGGTPTTTTGGGGGGGGEVLSDWNLGNCTASGPPSVVAGAAGSASSITGTGVTNPVTAANGASGGPTATSGAGGDGGRQTFSGTQTHGFGVGGGGGGALTTAAGNGGGPGLMRYGAGGGGGAGSSAGGGTGGGGGGAGGAVGTTGGGGGGGGGPGGAAGTAGSGSTAGPGGAAANNTGGGGGGGGAAASGTGGAGAAGGSGIVIISQVS